MVNKDYQWLIVNDVLSRTVSELSQLIVQILGHFAFLALFPILDNGTSCFSVSVSKFLFLHSTSSSFFEPYSSHCPKAQVDWLCTQRGAVGMIDSAQYLFCPLDCCCSGPLIAYKHVSMMDAPPVLWSCVYSRCLFIPKLTCQSGRLFTLSLSAAGPPVVASYRCARRTRTQLIRPYRTF